MLQQALDCANSPNRRLVAKVKPPKSEIKAAKNKVILAEHLQLDTNQKSRCELIQSNNQLIQIQVRTIETNFLTFHGSSSYSHSSGQLTSTTGICCSCERSSQAWMTRSLHCFLLYVRIIVLFSNLHE